MIPVLQLYSRVLLSLKRNDFRRKNTIHTIKVNTKYTSRKLKDLKQKPYCFSIIAKEEVLFKERINKGSL